MVLVNVRKDKEEILELVVTGHAGQAPEGRRSGMCRSQQQDPLVL